MNFFILFHLALVWYAIFSPVYCFFNGYRIDYALTNKRLYCTSGLIGLDIASAKLPEVQRLRVDVGALGAVFKRALSASVPETRCVTWKIPTKFIS